MPLTWYEAGYVDMLPMTSMKLRPIDSLGYPGRTYKFYNGSTVYPFGYGLSYTQFNYTLRSAKRSLDVKLRKSQHCRDIEYKDSEYKPPCPSVLIDDLECNHEFGFGVEVKNVGKRDGSEVIIVYSKPPIGIAATHTKQVIGFKRVFVKAGKSETVNFVFNACKSLGLVNYNAYNLLTSGRHTIMLGDDVVSFPIQLNIKE